MFTIRDMSNNQKILISQLFIAICTFGTWAKPVLGEGSRDLYPDPAVGNRGNIEWRSSSVLGFKQRTLLRVFANAGEYILVGSSAVGINSGDIEIFNPNTVTGSAANENLPTNANFSCISQRSGQSSGTGNGFIPNRTQELAGPQSIDGLSNTTGYTPCSYQAPTTGIYYVAIYGPSGKNSDSSPNTGATGSINNVNTSSNQNTGISAWDVTVRDGQSSTTDLNGRLHTYFISMNLGGNGRKLYSDLYPITIDGYRYKIDFKGLDPYGFRIFGNLLGNLDSNGTSPTYHDVLGTNGDIDNPEGGVESAPPQFPLFFNELDSQVLSYLQIYDPISGVESGTGFAASPAIPIVTTPTYSGNLSGNKSTINSGGAFSFNSNISGVYEIVISRDGADFDPTNDANRVLRGLITNSGIQNVPWDGLDNIGQSFPVGEFSYAVEVHAGEYHFPISDAENNVNGGPSYTLLNGINPLGNTTAFYDHRGYRTANGDLVEDRDPGDGNPTDDALCGSNPPDPAFTNPISGGDSTLGTFNKFGQSSGGNTNAQCTGAFGDTKTLDVWTYRPSTPARNSLVIVEFDYGDAPVSYDDTADNNNEIDSNDDPASHISSSNLYLGTVVADLELAPGSSNNANGDDEDDEDDEDGITSIPILEDNTTSYSLTATVNNSSGSAANVYAWIDLDRDGELDQDERATVADGTVGLVGEQVPTGGSGTVTLNWNDIGSGGADLNSGNSYVRIRLTTDNLDQSVQTTERDDASVGVASNGEVEDYPIVIGSNTNPNFAQSCTTDTKIAIVLDGSGSIDTGGGVQDVRDGIIEFIDQIVVNAPGTEVGIVEFAATAKTAIPFTPVTTTTRTNDFLPYINDVYHEDESTLDIFTNWEAGLKQASDDLSSANAVIFVTDGNPNRYLDNSDTVQSDKTTAENIQEAVQWANAIKQRGTHIYGFGIDNGVSEDNFKPITENSDDFEIFVRANNNADTADYSFVQTFAEFGSELTFFSQSICNVPGKPSIALVKRITDLNPNPDNIDFDAVLDDVADDDDNDPKWENNFLKGQISIEQVLPGDKVEYTVYFLSNGNLDANSFNLCDLIPENMTFVENGYGSNTGIELFFKETSSTLSNSSNDDLGEFRLPATTPPGSCKKKDPSDPDELIDTDDSDNKNGAIIINFDEILPFSISPGDPSNGYGFIRFKAKIKD